MTHPTWPDSHVFWRNKRVIVTGGSGFLGGFMVEKLRERGATEICVLRKRDYDLVQREAVLEMLHDARPHLIIHLAASVGGIGANWAHTAQLHFPAAGQHLRPPRQPFTSLRQAQYKRQGFDPSTGSVQATGFR